MQVDLHWLDWSVIAVYFLGIILLGLWAARRIHTTEDYFLGSRRFNVWLIIGQAFGIGTHAEMPVSLAGAVYRVGYSAIWYQWKNMFITPFYWILAPVFRRFRRTTIGEVYEDRYGNMMGIVYTLFALSFFVFNLGAMLKGAGKLISVAVGGGIDPNTVVFLMTATFILYSFVGGLVAAAWTDFVQSFFIILLSFLLVPLGLVEIGGFTGIRQSLDPQMLALITPGEIGAFVILMLTINGLIGIVAQPHILAAVGTGKDELTCRAGFMYGNFVKRFCTIGWALVGLIVVVMVAREGSVLHDPEEAFGYATRHLLFPGAVGLMIAAVLAANMSTCSAMMVDSGALFTQNLYRRYFVKGKTDAHYLKAGRIAGLLITLLGVWFGYAVQTVLEAFLFTETIAAFMGISMFAALSWRRANRYGALMSLLASAGTFFYLTRQDYGVFLRWEAENFGIAMLVGFAALILVSYLTPPEDEIRLARFYANLDRPGRFNELTGQEEDLPANPDGHQLLVVHLLDLHRTGSLKELWRRYRVDLQGLAIGFLIVAALILLAWGIIRLP